MLCKKTFKSLVSIGILLLASLFIASPFASAKSNTSEPLVSVVGHLALPGPPAVKMFMQEHKGQQYLLIEQASETGFTVVNVTKPDKAAIVKQLPLPNHGANGQLQLTKAGLLLNTVSESTSKAATESSAAPMQTLNLLDVSDPANPKIIQTFTGVTTMMVDEGHELVYIVNTEGLWILRCKQEQAESNVFGCPADGSLSTEPNCSY